MDRVLKAAVSRYRPALLSSRGGDDAMRDIVDISIVGAGPAGATAALVVGQAECRSLLIDEQGQAGGQVWRAKDRSFL